MSLIFITGASRGYGQHLALAFGKFLQKPSKFVLSARDSTGLHDTAKQLNNACPSHDVTVFPADLGESQSTAAFAQHLKKECSASGALHHILIHNAGTLGTLGKVGEAGVSPSDKLLRDVHINITSFIGLTESFLQACLGHVNTGTVSIVNVSSLAAVRPYPTVAQYSTWKAAREMYMRCVAAEHASSGVRVLNYSPGPMHTNMTDVLASSPALAPPIRQQYIDMETKGGYMNAQASAEYCAQLVLTGSFDSHARIDFVDVWKSQHSTT